MVEHNNNNKYCIWKMTVSLDNDDRLELGIIGERAKRARLYQGCTNSSWCGIYIYIYVWRYVCHNSSACYAYVMWAELGHYHFLYVPAVLNVVTTGNGTGIKNVLKWNRALGFEFSIHPIFCLWRHYCSESKPILYQDTDYCKFLLYVCVEIDPFSCEQTLAI